MAKNHTGVVRPEFTERVTPLLEEYKNKLNAAIADVQRLLDESVANKVAETGLANDKPTAGPPDNRVQRLQRLLNQKQTLLRNLVPATRKLAQHVSQMVEHGAIDDLEKVELGLRLAEFESAISAAQESLSASLALPQ